MTVIEEKDLVFAHFWPFLKWKPKLKVREVQLNIKTLKIINYFNRKIHQSYSLKSQNELEICKDQINFYFLANNYN